MTHPNLFVLIVDDPKTSRKFYSDLLQKEPVGPGEGFAMYPLDTGAQLAIWARKDAKPDSTVGGGSAELVFNADSRAEVDATHADWQAKGIAIAQPPTEVVFGYTFVGLDPDGHRLRVLALRG